MRALLHHSSPFNFLLLIMMFVVCSSGEAVEPGYFLLHIVTTVEIAPVSPKLCLVAAKKIKEVSELFGPTHNSFFREIDTLWGFSSKLKN